MPSRTNFARYSTARRFAQQGMRYSETGAPAPREALASGRPRLAIARAFNLKPDLSRVLWQNWSGMVMFVAKFPSP